ncbi:peptidase dimerization domain-containing protein [Nonomuraea rubra]
MGVHAYPHQARNPVLVLAHAVVALHSLAGTSVDPTHAATLVVAQTAAGTADNAIPTLASARGYRPRSGREGP